MTTSTPAKKKSASTARSRTTAGRSAANHAAKAPARSRTATAAGSKARSNASAARRAVAPVDAKAQAMSKARALAPQLAARIGSTPATKFRGNPDIFGRLVEDHDRHRALLAMISETQGKSPERERLFRELVREIKSHAAAEEQALWSTVMRNPKTTDDARHAVHEHYELDKLLADLAARDMSSSGWLRRFESMREEYLHHLREEEQEQFLHAQKTLSDTDVRYMRRVFHARKTAEKAAAKVTKKIKLKD